MHKCIKMHMYRRLTNIKVCLYIMVSGDTSFWERGEGEGSPAQDVYSWRSCQFCSQLILQSCPCAHPMLYTPALPSCLRMQSHARWGSDTSLVSFPALSCPQCSRSLPLRVPKAPVGILECVAGEYGHQETWATPSLLCSKLTLYWGPAKLSRRHRGPSKDQECGALPMKTSEAPEGGR